MSDITVNNFKAFYEQIRPYLGAVHSGFTPIGTVISVMGTTAPLNYLACDGTVYNISDYTELAAYFNAQFGSSNFFGGNGTTTFAVPDLRGEFLRGTGTNSHANQGSGANVGVHQDGTEIPTVDKDTNNKWINVKAYALKGDSFIKGSQTAVRSGAGSTFTTTETDIYSYTTRPTNTSVLYCIASKNIFMDAGSNYSTEEQVVGTWVDGSYIYQRTYINLDITTSPNAWTKTNIDLPNNWNKFIKFMVHDGGGAVDYFSMNGEDGKIQLYNSRNSNQHVDTITTCYTKTS